MVLKELVKNVSVLNLPEVVEAVIRTFGVTEPVNWDAVLPAKVQKDNIGGETLRFIADHPTLAGHHDIRSVCLMRGSKDQLLFMYVSLEDERLPKTAIERITRKFLGGNEAGRYIVWFFSSKKADTLKVVISGKVTRKVALKMLSLEAGEWFRTYDLILKEVNTRFNAAGFFKEPSTLWKALWDSLDISIVNKEFFQSIKQHFTELVDGPLASAECPLEGRDAKVQFAIRLIGRVLFCWFLKKKKIVADAVLSSDGVKTYPGYYKALLEPLFFDVFNTAKPQRPKSVPEAIRDYPFLNGGLFEAQAEDFVGHEGIVIPDEWFSMLFGSTLERFNFTIDESNSSSEEIAVDPEMLGRIFENLLAEQNEETRNTARNETGSFYTPRQIVDYQVEESLRFYLEEKLELSDTPIVEPQQGKLFGKPDKAPQALLFDPHKKVEAPKRKAGNPETRKAIHEFVHNPEAGLPDVLKPYLKSITDALENIKVLDPACGSGAYPMGMLHKLLALKTELAPPQSRKAKNYHYLLKLKTLGWSIFGVDLQPMAVELSRLRAWLSLIIDEEGEPEALPNLNFKFTAANTLLRLTPDHAAIEALTKGVDTTKRLIDLRGQYFRASEKEKEKIKTEFKKLQDGFMASSSSKGIKERGQTNTEIRDKIQNWKPFENHTTDWFDPWWMFGVKDFDVVIGNPPYIQLQSMGEKVKADLKAENYQTFAKTGDIYCVFYERGFDLLGKGGVLSLITSNKWMRGGYGKTLRSYLSTQTTPLELLDFAGFQVFQSATVDTNILIAKKGITGKALSFPAVHFKHDFQPGDDLNSYVSEKGISFAPHSEDAWVILDDMGARIKEKMSKAGKPLKDWDVKINRGILTGCNEAFIIDTETKERLCREDGRSAEVIGRSLNGEDIDRWGAAWKDWWVINIPNGWTDDHRGQQEPENFFSKRLPAVYTYLKEIGDLIEKGTIKVRGNGLYNRTDQGGYWWELRACAYQEDFPKPKIVYPETMRINKGKAKDFPRFAWDALGFTNDKTCFMMTGEKEIMYYLLGVLNSKAGYQLMVDYVAPLDSGGYMVKKESLVKIPVVEPSHEVLKEISVRVEKAIQLKAKGDIRNLRILEGEIDEIAYQVYGLDAEEVGFIVASELEPVEGRGVGRGKNVRKDSGV